MRGEAGDRGGEGALAEEGDVFYRDTLCCESRQRRVSRGSIEQRSFGSAEQKRTDRIVYPDQPSLQALPHHLPQVLQLLRFRPRRSHSLDELHRVVDEHARKLAGDGVADDLAAGDMVGERSHESEDGLRGKEGGGASACVREGEYAMGGLG